MAQLWSCGQSSGWRREAIMRWGETVRLFLVYRLTASQARSVPRDVWCVCTVGTPPCLKKEKKGKRVCCFAELFDSRKGELAREGFNGETLNGSVCALGLSFSFSSWGESHR
jgi:hypothetical protein